MRKGRSVKTSARKRKSPPAQAGISLAEKVMDFAQEAVAQVGALVKTAAAHVTAAPDNKAGREARDRGRRP
jgi:hypothetical protein